MTATIWSGIGPPQRSLIVNPTASMPRGIYRLVLDRPARRHDIVAVILPSSVAALAAARGYLIARRPALKRVAGIRGDLICQIGAVMSINGRLAAIARARDRHGRLLPRWHGCRRLRTGEIFLLGTATGSFDSRYFGAVSQGAVVGVAQPMWTMRN